MFGLTEEEERGIKAKLDEIIARYPFHAESDLVVMAVNRLWIDLVESDKEEPTMEEWRNIGKEMGYESRPSRPEDFTSILKLIERWTAAKTEGLHDDVV